MSKGYEGIKKKETKKEVHPKSPQGKKEEGIFKKGKNDRPIKSALKGLGAKVNPEAKHKTKKGL